MNLYDGTLTFGGDTGSIQIGSQTIAIPTVTFTKRRAITSDGYTGRNSA